VSRAHGGVSRAPWEVGHIINTRLVPNRIRPRHWKGGPLPGTRVRASFALPYLDSSIVGVGVRIIPFWELTGKPHLVHMQVNTGLGKGRARTLTRRA
jgi:hypothetical protein